MNGNAPGGPTLTTTAQIEDRLVYALRDIRTHWHALLEPTRSGGAGSPSSDDVTPLDHRISLRHEATMLLNSWARVIVDDRELTHHLPLGTDVPGLVIFLERWARWFSGHEAAPDAVEELADIAGRIKATAAPRRREWIYLGDCPFVIPEWALFCTGQVRYPVASVDADPDAFCSDCGQIGKASWWEEVITGRCAEMLDREELPALLYRTFGRHVSRPTLHRWIKAGELVEQDGRFDRAQVVAAVATRWAS